ncbi:hypothetical protein [Parageobacillus thermoglucosidasius]
MGESGIIVDLMKNLIKLSGYIFEEIGMEFIGIRPRKSYLKRYSMKTEIHPE